MDKATCSECGKEFEIPFKRDLTIPFYCKACEYKRTAQTQKDIEIYGSTKKASKRARYNEYW